MQFKRPYAIYARAVRDASTDARLREAISRLARILFFLNYPKNFSGHAEIFKDDPLPSIIAYVIWTARDERRTEPSIPAEDIINIIHEAERNYIREYPIGRILARERS